MDRDELILQKLSELAEDVKNLRKNVGGLQKDITDVKLQQADDRRRSETADVKLAASLERIESKLTRDLQRVEAEVKTDLQRLESKIDGGLDRIDGVVTNISERKADTNEHWEIGGIVVSIFLAVSAFVKSFFFS